MTYETEKKKELERKIAQLEEELRLADRAKAAQRKLIDDLEKQVKKWKERSLKIFGKKLKIK